MRERLRRFLTTRWRTKLLAFGAIALGAIVLVVAVGYLVIPRLEDSKLESKLSRLDKVDPSSFLPPEVQTGRTPTPQPSSTPSSGATQLPPTAPSRPTSTPQLVKAADNVPLARNTTFRYANWDEVARTPDSAIPKATRIVIPVLDLDEKVVDIFWTEDDEGVRRWDTPKFAVGRFFDGPKVGSSGDVWLWGHLQSFIRREGNVFERLPELADYLLRGQRVDVYLYAEDRVWVYRVVNTFKAQPDEVGDLIARQSGEPTINMVTCWPPQGYWERVIVTAKLVQVGEIQSAQVSAPAGASG